MMTDPIADMLTRIRNANAIERAAVEMPATGLKIRIAAVLKDEGFIRDYLVGEYPADTPKSFKEGVTIQESKKPVLRILLKYGEDGEKVIRTIKRWSKPGRRYYRPVSALPRVLDGLGIAIVSTSRGVFSDRKARELGVGGEILCTVW